MTTKISEIKRKPNPNVIETLKELLTDAENGHIIDMSYVCRYKNQTFGWGLIGIEDRFESAGHFQYLAMKVLYPSLAASEGE